MYVGPTWTAMVQHGTQDNLCAIGPLGMSFREFAARLIADDPLWRRKPHFVKRCVSPSVVEARINMLVLPGYPKERA